MTRLRLHLAAVALLAAVRPLAAQDASPDLARLDPETRAAVVRVIDSTRAAGLPTTPLEWKVAEGITKGADGSRILAAVRRSADGLRRAREALGGDATTPELVAGAGALQIGVPPATMRQLRGAQAGRPVTLRLVVLSDLVSRGVPLGDATSAVVRLSSLGATDAEFTALRTEVLRDIQAGATPTAALSSHARRLAPAARDSNRAPPEL